MLEYISPSSYHTYLTQEKTFYLKYIRGLRRQSTASEPMLLGSLVDGYIKSYIAKLLFGDDSDYKQYRNDGEEGVTQQLQDIAAHVFSEYIEQGCFHKLMEELSHSISPPKFEFKLHNEIEGVPLLGYPDLYFTTKAGTLVVYDWKVNGYFGATTTSPAPGYIDISDKPKDNPSQPHPHKSAELIIKSGIRCNKYPIGKTEWVNQLTIYSWLLGNPVGSEDHVLGIDQFVCNPPRVRIAIHRSQTPGGYQRHLLGGLKDMWENINSESWLQNQDRKYGKIADAYEKELDNPYQQSFREYVRDVSAEHYQPLAAI